MAKLFVVSTPIGNLEDITLRAIDTLKSVDTILCEDTRETKKVLNKYDISTPVLSYPADDASTSKIFKLLEEGKDLALVSDAGTPGISDPGAVLVSKVKEKMPEVRILSIPGATALIAALSVCGLPIHEFTFLGFLPHKKGRETLFKEIAQADRTYVFYESPHRILKTLELLVKFCPNKKVCVARELTKIYEEIESGTPEEMLAYYTLNGDKVRGEFVVLVA